MKTILIEVYIHGCKCAQTFQWKRLDLVVDILEWAGNVEESPHVVEREVHHMQAGQQGQLQGEGRQPVGGELHLPYKGYWNLQ